MDYLQCISSHGCGWIRLCMYSGYPLIYVADTRSSIARAEPFKRKPYRLNPLTHAADIRSSIPTCHGQEYVMCSGIRQESAYKYSD